MHYYTVHVLYSTTYSVPVLYFAAALSGTVRSPSHRIASRGSYRDRLTVGEYVDGRPLECEQLWRELPERYRVEGSRWSFITQAVRVAAVLQARAREVSTHAPAHHVHVGASDPWSTVLSAASMRDLDLTERDTRRI